MAEARRNASLIAVVAVAVVALVGCRLAGLATPALFAKLAASSGFVLLAWFAGAAGTRYGRWILAGLVLSWCGDLLLEGGDRYFLAGLVSFLLAHLAYIGGFLGRGVAPSWVAAALLPLAAVSGTVYAWLEPSVPANLKPAVGLYTAVISAMVVCAVGSRGRGASWLLPAGALLFYVSDLSVAAGQFLRPDFPNYVWGLPCYFTGQVLLASSVRVSEGSRG